MRGFPLGAEGFRMRPELGRLGRLGRAAQAGARPLGCSWGWPRTDGGLGSRWLLCKGKRKF